jgi:Cu/Zn superoxide dismutase
MTKKFWSLVVAPGVLALALGACGGDDDDDDDNSGGSGGGGGGNPPAASASAVLTGDDGRALGTATFTKKGNEVEFVAEISGAKTTGVQVGLHIHQKAVCDAAVSPPFSSAGDHWNPGHPDGDYGPAGSSPNSGYLGELGKITLDDSGAGRLVFSSPNWQIGTGAESDVVGRAIILHIVDDTPDDGKGAPRQGCGEVEASKAN